MAGPVAAAPSSAGVAQRQAVQPHEYYMGPGTFKVDRKCLHEETRQRLAKSMNAQLEASGAKAGVVLLQGGTNAAYYSSDTETVFVQEHNMFYLFGLMEADCFGALDLRTGSSLLFMPRLPPAYAVWLGPLKEPAFYKAKYAVDSVHYVDELPAVLRALQPPCLHLLAGVNSDSGKSTEPAHFVEIAEFTCELEALFPAINECRVKKSVAEQEVIAYANKVGSAGHVAIMQGTRPGLMEYQIESLFLHTCYYNGGARLPFYTPISAAGTDASTLHYGHAEAPNDHQIEDDDYILADFGCEYYHYGSDITTTFPANGKFTNPDHRGVYEAVLRAHDAILAAMKPGVPWPDMQTLAYRIILGGLLDLGVVCGGDVDQLLEADVGGLFMPHGVGHFMGLSVHDVGGYPVGGPPRIDRPGYRSLRTARPLEEGMVITVEPGCYFNPALLLPALQDSKLRQYLNEDRVKELLKFGGVRLEDNVLVTAHGCHSFTHVPRKPADVERVMAGAPWPLPAGV